MEPAAPIKRRRALTVVLAAASVIAVALPALGLVTKEGTRACGGSTPFAYTHSYSSGTTKVRGPGASTFVQYPFTSGMVHRDTFGSYGGGSWKVEVVGGSLSDPGTYGYCEAFG